MALRQALQRKSCAFRRASETGRAVQRRQSLASATLVVRTGSKGAVGFRFSPAGELLDTVPIAINDAYGGLVATNGTDFFVVWAVGSDYWQFPAPDMYDVVPS